MAIPYREVMPYIGDMTIKENKLLQLIVESGFDMSIKNRLACAEAAGYSQTKAVQNIGRVLKKATNNLQMRAALAQKGISYERMAGKIDELLEAKHPQFPTRPDNLVQLKAWEDVARVMDVNPATKVDVESHQTHEIVITEDCKARIERATGAEIIEGEIIEQLPPD